MPSTYTLNNGIELIATGEQSGTWGDTTNTNLSLLDTALDGQVTVTLPSAGTSGSPNTLAISDGAASDGRNRMVIFNDGGDLGATAYVQLTPNDAEKIIYIRNDLAGSRSIILFQGTYNASNDYEVPAGTTAVIYFDGAGSGAVAANVFNNAYFDSLRLGSVSVTAIIDDDTMATASATNIATSESIKAYVDTQVGANNELSEVLANGNTTGGTDISVSTGDDITFADSSKAIFGAGSDLQIYHNGSHSIISDEGTGSLLLQGTSQIVLQHPSTGEDYIVANNNGAVSLYYDNAEKLATTSTGIDVTGTVTADGLTVDGSGTVNITSSSVDTLQLTRTDVGGGTRILMENGNDNIWRIQNDGANVFSLAYNTSTAFGISNNGDISFYEDTGTTPKFFWDASAERLGIGTSSPSVPLEVASSGSSILQITSGTNTSQSALYFADPDDGNVGLILYDHTSNYMSFRTNGSGEDMRITSSGRVGIGTTSPSGLLTVEGSVGSASISTGGNVLFFSRNSANYISAVGGSSGFLAFHTGSTNTDPTASVSQRMVIDSSGNVGIGITPSAWGDSNRVALQVNSASIDSTGVSQMLLRSNNYYDGTDNIYVNTGAAAAYQQSSGVHTWFTAASGTAGNAISFSETMRIDSSGNLLVGRTTTPPTAGAKIALASTGDTAVQITKDGVVAGRVMAVTTGLAFGVDGSDGATERMRIDSSGNVLVGRTDVGFDAEAIVLRERGEAYITSDGRAPLLVNRLTSDGDIVSFRKDGTTVGSIGSYNGTDTYITGGSGNSTGVVVTSNAIVPSGSAGATNTNVNLGLSAAGRSFKDLYLSGGVYLGGTGAANKLDDYEEGTWTPSLQNVTVSYTSRSGTYTKIGRLVFATMDMDVSSLDTTDVSGFTVTLPFAAPTGGDKSALFSASIKYNESNALVPSGNTDFLNSGGKVNGSTMNIRAPYETGGGTDPTYASLNSSGSIIFSIMYYAA